MSSDFHTSYNMPTTYFPVFKQMQESSPFLPEWWNCVLTAALRQSLTATLRVMAMWLSVLVKMVSMADE